MRVLGGTRRRFVIAAAVFAAGILSAVAASGAPLPFSFTATETKTYSGPVAQFDHTCTSDCTATIAWGDGKPGSTGVVKPNSGATQTVEGSHVYDKKGQYQATVAILGGSCRGADCNVATNTATVVDAPLKLSGGEFTVAQGDAKEQTVASFTDEGPNRPGSAYKATVEWGDGTSSAASVVANQGSGFDVRAGHAYGAEGDRTYTVKVDEDGDGQAVATATGKARVAGSLLPQPSLSFAPAKPVAGVPIVFSGDAALATNAGPAKFTWRFCAAGAGCVEKAGQTVEQALTLAPPNQNTRAKLAPGNRRRTTWTIELTATDKLDRAGKAVGQVTVVPNTLPRATFDVVRQGGGAHGLLQAAGYPVLGDVVLRPTAADPDPGDAIAELRWELSGDGADDLSCRPGLACVPLPNAFRQPMPPPQKLKKEGHPGIDMGLQSPPATTLLDIGEPVTNPAANVAAPGIAEIGAPQGIARAASARRAGRARARAAVNLGKGLDFQPPPAFGPLTWNFGRMHLAQEGVPLGKTLGELPPPPFTKPYPTPGENFAAVLREYHSASEHLAETTNYRFPKRVRLTAVDRAGGAAVAEQPIALRNARFPKVEINFKRDDPSGPVTTNHDFDVTIQSAKDPEGKPLWFVLELGKLGQSRCTTAETYGEAIKPGWAAALSCGSVGIQAPGKAIGQPFVKTFVAPTLDALKAQLADAKAKGQLRFSALGLPGTYAASLSVYDEQGLGTHGFVSGIKVVASESECKNISTELNDDPTVHIAGDCISFSESTDRYTSTKAIKVNGLVLRPGKGATIGIKDEPSPKITATPAGSDVYVLAGDTPVGVFQPTEANGRVLFGDSAVSVDVIEDAVFRDLPVAPGSLTARLGNKASDLHLELKLPAVFGAGETPTSPVDVHTTIKGSSTRIERFSILGPSAEKVSAEAASAGGGRARAAQTLPSFKLGPTDTTVGGIGVNDLVLEYDNPTDTWTGQGTVSIPGIPVDNVKGKFVIRGDQLIQLAGTVSVPGGVPIAPGVTANTFTFEGNFGDDPNIFAGMRFKAAGILDGDGSVRVHTANPRVRFDGTIGIGGFIPLGSAYLDVSPQTGMAFGGQVGYDFGPASFHAGVNGWVNAKGDFAVIGRGESCLFACLDIDALASSIGIAGCGTVDLVLTSVTAGFGYRYGDGLSVWVNSCDLQSFVPPATAAQAAKAPLLPGQLAQIDVKAGEDSLAVQARGAGTGQVAPRVTLTGPGGRVVKTPAGLGDYEFGGGGSSLVDANPLDRTTSMLVAKPAPGKWTLTVDPGSAPVEKVDWGLQLDPVTAKTFDVSVKKEVEGESVASHAKKGGAKKAAVKGMTFERGVRDLPAFARKRLRSLTYDVGSLQGKVTFVSRRGNGGKVLGTVGGGKEGHIVFDPPEGGGKHDIVAFVTRNDGMPRLARNVAAYTLPGAANLGGPGVGKLSRKGDDLTVNLEDGPLPGGLKGALAYVAEVDGGDGSHRSVPVRNRDLKKRKGGWKFTVTDAPRTASVKVSVRAVWRGETGPASSGKLPRKGKAPKKLP